MEGQARQTADDVARISARLGDSRFEQAALDVEFWIVRVRGGRLRNHSVNGSVANAADFRRDGEDGWRGEIVSDFKGRHFEGEIVLWAVRWYCRYGVSYRDLEQMIAARQLTRFSS